MPRSKARPRPPLLPRSPSDPTDTDALERGAMADMRRRLRAIRAAYIDALESIPREEGPPVTNGLATNAPRRYVYQLDAATLNYVLGGAASTTELLLLEGGADDVWIFRGYVSTAYQRGTAQQFANLSRQSRAYAAEAHSLANIIQSEPYRRRLALVAAREFEEMKGLAGGIQANLSRVLTDGMGRGQNPLEIARRITAQTGIEEHRARRIARTEITTALRRARMDEAEDAAERYGLENREMHFSALSPTTRISHAERHGKLFTVEQQRQWWSEDGNSINCKCTTISVLVDETGAPMSPDIVERARAVEQRVKADGRGPWRKVLP